MSRFALGSYTQHTSFDARGKGISIVEWDDESDEYSILDISTGIENPTYLAWLSSRNQLFAVSELENKTGAAAALKLSSEGILSLQNQVKADTKSACHIAVSTEEQRIYTASYGGGSLSSFHLDSRGVGEAIMSRIYQGHGLNTSRQEGSHAHQVAFSPYGSYLYVCDLGCDAIWLHSLDTADNPDSGLEKALAAPGGYGPRHLAFHPELPAVYILCELVPRLLVASINPLNGKMDIVQELDTAAAENRSLSAPAAVKVHPSGKTVVVSNRFDDTIAVFLRNDIGENPGLIFADRFSCGGKVPRDIEFNSSGSRLFIANQDSHNLSCRKFNSTSGLPGDGWAEGLKTGSPVCVVMLD